MVAPGARSAFSTQADLDRGRNGLPRTPSKGFGICLSGGGYRAMLFHVGVLWRLNDAGQLGRLTEVSSVSGGSITAGVLGLAWEHLSFNGHGIAHDFGARVVAPIRELARRRIDRRAVLIGAVVPGLTAAGRVAAAYRRHLFDRATLQDLPDRPRFIFNATNLASGALVRFSKRYVADWRVGRIESPDLDLGGVVASSSAFPPFLSPYRLSLDGSSWITEEGNDLTNPEYRDRWLLSDGGVYDNMGLETVWKRCRTLIISDAGGQLDVDPRPRCDWPRHLVRTLGVVDSQVRALRTRQVITSFKRRERLGFYVGIRGDIARYSAPNALPAPKAHTTRLAQTPTRLAPVDSQTQQRLINWGYAICDAGLRRRLDPSAPPPPGFPYPEAGVG